MFAFSVTVCLLNTFSLLRGKAYHFLPFEHFFLAAFLYHHREESNCGQIKGDLRRGERGGPGGAGPAAPTFLGGLSWRPRRGWAAARSVCPFQELRRPRKAGCLLFKSITGSGGRPAPAQAQRPRHPPRREAGRVLLGTPSRVGAGEEPCPGLRQRELGGSPRVCGCPPPPLSPGPAGPRPGYPGAQCSFQGTCHTQFRPRPT